MLETKGASLPAEQNSANLSSTIRTLEAGSAITGNVYTKEQLDRFFMKMQVGNYKDDLVENECFENDGSIRTGATSWYRTPLYSVHEGDEINIQKPYVFALITFDNSNNYVYTENVGRETETYTYTIPSGVAFIALNIYKPYLNQHSCTVNGADLGATYVITLTNGEWYGKRYISHGDSITAQDGSAYTQGAHQGETARGYQTVLRERLQLASCNNKGRSGWSMAVTDRGGIVNTIKAVSDYSVYDLCTIACGTNDFKLNVPMGTLGQIGDTNFDTSTFCGAYRTAIEYILTSSPTIRLVLMTPIQRDNAGYDVNYTNSAGHKLIDYVNAVKQIGQMYGLPVCDLYSNSGITALTLDTYTMDGLHPNDDGYERMGSVLADFLMSKGI